MSFFNNPFKKNTGAFSNKVVLIVEDSEVDRKLIVHTLKELGCKIMIAENGSEGYVKALSHKPDVILTDCSMPHIDGVEMCRQIKEDEQTKDIPIVFLTGVDSPRNVIDCFDVDAENFLSKPINPKELTDQIQQLLEDPIEKD